MKQKIVQIGNSAGLIIPKALLQDLGLHIGSEVTIEKDPNGNIAAFSKDGEIFESSITPHFLRIVDRLNKKYGPAFKELANLK